MQHSKVSPCEADSGEQKGADRWYQKIDGSGLFSSLLSFSSSTPYQKSKSSSNRLPVLFSDQFATRNEPVNLARLCSFAQLMWRGLTIFFSQVLQCLSQVLQWAGAGDIKTVCKKYPEWENQRLYLSILLCNPPQTLMINIKIPFISSLIYWKIKGRTWTTLVKRAHESMALKIHL